MNALSQRFVLTLACANGPGIVAAVAGHLTQAGLNILDVQQYDDAEMDRASCGSSSILNGRKTVVFAD